MAKLLGPDFISLQVRNLSASRAFYTELLGFTIDPRFNTPDFVLFDSTSIPFALSEAKVNLDEAPHPGWGVTLWIDCDNVNELHAKLDDAGATIITPPYDGPFGRTFVATLNYGSVRIPAEPLNARRQDNVSLLDLRFERVTRVRKARVSPFVDIYNLTNANPIQNTSWSSGSSFLRPLAIVPPRVLRIGGKVDW